MALGMADVARLNYETYLAYQGKGTVKVVNPDAEFTMRAIIDKHKRPEFPCTSGLIEYS